MSDIGNNLRIKYGLGQTPSLALQNRWADRVLQLIAKNFTSEQAGALAAKELFHDFQTRFYASTGDTIEFLLQRVKDK